MYIFINNCNKFILNLLVNPLITIKIDLNVGSSVKEAKNRREE
jgi:hypothetical protein